MHSFIRPDIHFGCRCKCNVHSSMCTIWILSTHLNMYAIVMAHSNSENLFDLKLFLLNVINIWRYKIQKLTFLNTLSFLGLLLFMCSKCSCIGMKPWSHLMFSIFVWSHLLLFHFLAWDHAIKIKEVWANAFVTYFCFLWCPCDTID